MAGHNAPKGYKLEESKMAIEVKQETEEQTQQDQTRQAALHKSVRDNLIGDKIQSEILKDLGLSPGSEKQGKAPAKKVEAEEVEQEEETEEANEEEEATQDDAQGTEEESEEDEEVIPKSKVQKRFDELTAKNKYLEQQIEELKATKAEPKDDVTKQLEAMTTAELKSAKLEVRKAQIKAQDDDAKLNELLALEDKIDSVIKDAPSNFAKAQANAFAKAASELTASGDIPNLSKVAPEIIKIAKEIYDENPDFQKSITGQASALKLAVKHFKAMNAAPGDKTKETELKRQVNNLKKKTTLDTKTGKVNADKSKHDALRKAAIGGTQQQKVDLVRSHPMFNVDKMIPDELK